MEKTLLFYDIETTGLSKSFDQVIEFAAIRTDLDLNILEEIEYLIRLNPDTVPSPQAMLTHHIPLSRLMKGMTELEAIRGIHEQFNRPGTISLGYNTLGFDDEFLRFSFFRNLLPPYTHQYAQNCGRADLYPITVFFYLYCPEALQWPKVVVEGVDKVSLKLEDLNNENQLAAGQAHHAMVDVQVTVQLARKFKQYPEIWAYAFGFFDKAEDQKRTHSLEEGLWISGQLGPHQSYQAWVLRLGPHQVYRNQCLWLRLDRPNFTEHTSDQWKDSLWVLQKKWGEPGFLLPLKPRFLKYWSLEQREQVQQNKAWLQAHPDRLSDIQSHYCNYTYPPIEGLATMASLYQCGFPTDQDMAICHKFHGNPSNPSTLMCQFTSAHLKALAERLLMTYFPEGCSEAILSSWKTYLQQLIHKKTAHQFRDHQGKPHLSFEEALESVQSLLAHPVTASEHQLLKELECYFLECYQMNSIA